MPTRFPVVRLKPLGHPSCNRKRGARAPPSDNRGARIRTGDLCDPNAALYRTEPRPVATGSIVMRRSVPSGGGGTRTPKCLRTPHFECGALPIRTTPPAALNRGSGMVLRAAPPSSGVSGARAWRHGRLRLEQVRTPLPQFAVRSRREWDGPPGGSAVLGRLRRPRLAARPPPARTSSNPIPSVRCSLTSSNPIPSVRCSLTEGVGFEPT